MYVDRMLTLHHRRSVDQWRDYKLPEVEKGVETDEVGIYSALHDGAVERKPTCPID